MRGPRGEVERAYAVLGRKPTFVAREVATATKDTDAEQGDDEVTAARVAHETIRRREAREEKELAAASAMLQVESGYATSSFSKGDATGLSFGVDGGIRLNRYVTVGGYLSLGYVSGSYAKPPPMPGQTPYTVAPVDAAGFVRGTLYDRVWAMVLAGVHLDFEQELASSSSDVGLGVGAALGVDVLHIGIHHVGVFVRAVTELGGDAGYDETTFGIYYRR
jgi:hypothetical protein